MIQISMASPVLYLFLHVQARFCTDICSALGNTSFTDLLMGNNVGAFDFVDSFSEYSGISDAMSQYSSLEGDYPCSSMYDNDFDLGYLALPDNVDMFLPIPRIQTASPPALSPTALQYVEPEIPNSKRPRAPVAADLERPLRTSLNTVANV